jgi:hypothetical protein
MKNLVCLLLLPISAFALQTLDLHQVRMLYHTAAEVKQDAAKLNKLVLQVDSNALPVMICYKGANEMMQAKYAINPITKLDKFNKGKDLIQKASAVIRLTWRSALSVLPYKITCRLF